MGYQLRSEIRVHTLCPKRGHIVFAHNLTKLESVAKPSVMVALRFTEVELLWQHAKIALPQQKGRSGAIFNDTMKLADLKNPQCGTTIRDISPIQAELWAVLA